jgi:long-chain acyl-CoA synthetase
LVEDIGELKPTIFCAVPRVLDRIYGGTLLNLKIISVQQSKHNMYVNFFLPFRRMIMLHCFCVSGLQDKVSTGGFLKKTVFNVAYK